MAEVQKPVEVLPVLPAESAPVETAPIVDTPAVTDAAPVVEDKPTEEVKPAETTEATEAPKEEVKPIEEGQLNHKAQGLSFPKNLIGAKEFFFFGTDAVEPKSLAAYKKNEKSTETAQSNIAWASETGKGLLFVGDKKAPSSIISLADATEPEVEGANKFTLTSKGNKHTLKAANTAERDNWVSQLKLKIAEAKELSATVTESETYKTTLESFKPAPIVKKEEEVAAVAPAEAPKEEVVAAEETPVATEEAAKETPKEEAVKAEGSKRRSASRKRASFFGFGKKEEKKEATAEETPAEDTPATEANAIPVETAPVAETEAPKVEETPATDAPVVSAATLAPEETVESPKERPTPTAAKRNSFFGGVFSKKEKKATETTPVESTEAPKEGEVVPADETAPVIPPVETTTPLAVDVSSPATVPTETVEVAPATNGEPKKDVKEKRKSSLPFAFGKREKSPAPVEGEQPAGKSAFSKLRATIKGKSAPKAEDKPAEEAVTEEAKPEETAVAEPVGETAAVVEPVKPVEPEVENKPETVTSTTPAVTAAA